MRSLVVATCAAFLHTSCAFTAAPRTSPLIIASPRHRAPLSSVTTTYATGNNNHDDDDEIELVPSLQQIMSNRKQQITEHDDTTTAPTIISRRQRIQSKLLQLYERTNTLQAAGLYNNNNNNDPNSLQPLQAGFKSNVMLLVGAFLFKWYRARFINKIPVWDRQPQWNMVVTSPEQEKELHAYSCKQCGATIFIARHREWFFKGGNTECTNCGATGVDNFEDIRGEVIDSIDDDYFDYESPLDFVSAAERRKLVKQAGGDEELAKKIAIENVMKNDKEQIQVEEEETTSASSSKKDKKKKKKKSDCVDAPKQESAPKKKKKTEEDDIFDELDMDI